MPPMPTAAMGAARDDDRLGRLDDLRRAFAGLHGDGLGAGDAGVAVEKVDPVGLEERPDAARELLDDALFPVLELVRVDARVVDHEAERRAALHLLEGVARGDDGLAWDAPPVEANAAHFVFFDAEHLLLELYRK